METVILVVVLLLTVCFLGRRLRRSVASEAKHCAKGCSGCSRGARGVLTGVLVLLSIGPARAADTVETWDVGATDVDLYLGVDGLSRQDQAKTLTTFGEIMLGYGLVDRLSAHVGIRVESNEYFSEGMTIFSLGLFGTPLDTRHFDLDLFLALSGGGGEVELYPSVELNLDSAPDMMGVGLYLRSGLPLSGRDQVTNGKDAQPEVLLTPRLELTFGAYYTIAAGHQVLIEHDLLVRFEPMQEERALEVGGFALGYNVALGSAIELINQFFVEVPQGDEEAAVGFMTGLIATLPSAQ